MLTEMRPWRQSLAQRAQVIEVLFAILLVAVGLAFIRAGTHFSLRFQYDNNTFWFQVG
jgi:hypothetical protein